MECLLSFIIHQEKSGGIYFNRWGDAPLHTIGVSLLLQKKDLHAFTDIGYRHLPFIDQVFCVHHFSNNNKKGRLSYAV